jgi:hypothetical protein
MKHLVVSLTVLAIALAGCSAADSGNQTQPPANSQAPANSEVPVATTAAPAEQATGAPDNNPLSGFGKDSNTAVVVIGGQSYEFADLYCVTLAGALGAESLGGDPKIDISLPPEGWETSGDEWDPPSVRIQGDDPYMDLVAGNPADNRITEEQSRVDSFSSDGHHATGTATFYDQAAAVDADQPPPSVSGTFEVTCPN